MPRNNGISWIKKSEPKFIREFKERIAYKEQASLEAKKKKSSSENRPDLVTEEKEEDKPQIVQLKSGDLGEKEYNDLREKEVISQSFASRGKIIFKKPVKKGESEASDSCSEPGTSGTQQEKKQEKIAAELDSIFDLNKKEDDNEEEDNENNKEKQQEEVKVAAEKKKIYLEDEEKAAVKEGLSQPAAKKSRLVDRIAENKVANSLSAAKVLAREAKSGNRKLLSFYDEEEEENEEYRQECFKEEIAKKAAQEDDDDSD